jgi:ArsR family metal-binding transcriptional regulator
MTKIFNTFKNNRGQIIPKSAIIKNDVDIIDWIKTMFPWVYDNNKKNIIETDEYLVIAFSVSQSGIIYINIYTENQEFVEKFGQRFVRNFIDNESVKKYVMWAYNLPKNIVNSNK